MITMEKIDLTTVTQFDAFVSKQKRLAFIMLSIEGCGWCSQQEKACAIVEEKTGVKTYHLFLAKDTELRGFMVNEVGFAYAPSIMIVQNGKLVFIIDPRYENTLLLNRFQDYEKLTKIATIMTKFKHVKRQVYGIFHDACIACSNYVPARRILFFPIKSKCTSMNERGLDPKHMCQNFRRSEIYSVYKVPPIAPK